MVVLGSVWVPGDRKEKELWRISNVEEFNGCIGLCWLNHVDVDVVVLSFILWRIEYWSFFLCSFFGYFIASKLRIRVNTELGCDCLQFCDAGTGFGDSGCVVSSKSASKLLIKGGTVVNAHHQEIADVYVEDGIIVAVKPNIKVIHKVIYLIHCLLCFIGWIWSKNVKWVAQRGLISSSMKLDWIAMMRAFMYWIWHFKIL